jgi:hypothetical protein
VKSLSEVYLPYGRSGILDCHFLSNPPLTNIRWEKDGFLFDPYTVPGVFYRKNGSLYFTKVLEIPKKSLIFYIMRKSEGQSVCTQSAISHPHLKIVIQCTVVVNSHTLPMFRFKTDYDRNAWPAREGKNPVKITGARRSGKGPGPYYVTYFYL